MLTAFGLTLREPAYVRRLYVYFQSLLGGETQNFVKGSARFFSFRTHHTSCASCEHLAIGGGGVPAESDPVRLLRAAAARDHVSSLSVWHSPLPRFLPVCRSCCRTFQVSAFGPPRSSSRQAARSFPSASSAAQRRPSLSISRLARSVSSALAASFPPAPSPGVPASPGVLRYQRRAVAASAAFLCQRLQLLQRAVELARPTRPSLCVIDLTSFPGVPASPGVPGSRSQPREGPPHSWFVWSRRPKAPELPS